MYINSYLDETYSQKLKYLTQQTHGSISEVVKQAIDFYYESSSKTKACNDILLQSGFIGCGEADSRLSENYKSDLEELMRNKHDNG